MKRTIIILSLALLPFVAVGQRETPDSIAVSYQHGTDRLIDSTNIYLNFDRKFSELSQPDLRNKFVTDTSAFQLPKINTNITPGVARISSWRNGHLYAAGGIQTMPGLMAINSGSLNVEQNFGNLNVNVYGVATKYGYFNGLQTSYGFGGALTYKFSEKVSATVFGEYHSGVRMNNPAMAGYVNIPRFGGYIDYSFSERFGVEVGAQGYQSMMTNRIEAQPIVRPYFRVSKNNKIGIDIGGILYQVLNSRGSQYNQSRNPTIGPPVQKLSQAMGY
ncbi:MAG: hypothetical protein K2J10_10555 [Muribaculaceae bacterium]|nr:hypothetical protein [Muribaculaceae bacterium]